MTIHSVGISQLGNFDYALTVAVGDGQPTISVDLIPGTFDGDGNLVTPHLVESGEAGSSILSLVVQADAPIPEGGLVVNINTDLADITQFIQGSNFIPTTFGGQVLGAVYGDDGKATGIQVRLDNTNMVVNFSTGLGLDAAGPQSVRFFVEPGEGYQPSSEQATVTVYDSLDQVPVATSLPEVSLSFVGSTIFEGLGTATLNFAVEGEIPAEGIVVYVDRGFFGALNDFDLFNARVQGGAFPAPDGQAGGFYFKITEPIASITLEVLVDELQEGIEAATFTLQPGAGYSVAADASRSTLLIADGPNAEIQVSYAASPEVLIETENTASVHTLSLSAPPPAGGLTVTVQAPSLGEFDTAGLVLSSGVTVTDVRLGEFDILLTEQTATIELPVANDGVAEGLETATFTLVAGDGYQVAASGNVGSFTIVDSLDQVPAAPVQEAGQNDTIATAQATGLTADNATLTINGRISGNFFDSDLSLRTDRTEDVDLYSVELAAGDVLRIDTDAQQFGSEADTLVRLFDAAGNALAQNDDAAAPDERFNDRIGFDSYLEFTANTAGTYFIGISTFSNGELDFITDPYDPNVVGSGSGGSSGEYTLNLALNQEIIAEPTVIPVGDGTGPVIAFTAIPSTLDGDAIVANALVQSVASADEAADLSSILTLQFSAEGEFPAEGVEVYLNSNVDLSDRLNAGFARGLTVLGAIYDETGAPTGLKINLTATSAFLTLNLESPETVPTDGTETLSLSLVPAVGYQADTQGFSTPIYDTLADVPISATPPTVSITASETALIESTGNTTTLTFSLSEAPPAEGILIYVDSETEGVISEFNVFDAVITGADAPFPNGDVSGFYLRMTEQTATLTVSAFDETTNPQLTPAQALEGIESVTFRLAGGQGYLISQGSSTVALTIADNPNSVVIPGDGGGDGGGGEEPVNNPENEFNDTIATAIATGLSATNRTYETLATLEVTDITLNPEAPDDERLFYANLVDITEDVDMYAFNLEAGQTITLDIDGGGTGNAGVAESTLDSILRIFDAAGTELAISENDAAPNEVFQANGDTYLQFTATAAGTYYAGVSVLGNTFYDPNVQGSGSGWIFTRFEPGAYRFTATLGDAPVPLPQTRFGSDASETLTGGSGNDVLYGNGGMDTLIGGDGNDLIYGGSQADTILGGSGNDTIYANGGGDLIDAGSGLDTVWLGAGAASIALNAGEGYVTVKNFQLGATQFTGGGSGLSFADSADGVKISKGDDLLAMVTWQTASTFSSNASMVFV